MLEEKGEQIDSHDSHDYFPIDFFSGEEEKEKNFNELFHGRDLKCYATIPINGHFETWPINSPTFKDWFLCWYFKTYGRAPKKRVLQEFIENATAWAKFEGPEYEVFVRVAHVGGKIFIDLANESWQVVEVSSYGWRVLDHSPVKFLRPTGLTSLPYPKMRNLEDLYPFINCREEDWPLVVAWLLGTFSPGPYPILILQGEQGSAKSTTARLLKAIVDPNFAPLRTKPRNEWDLMIAAKNSWCLSYDNLSGLRDSLSDSFCRLATGGGLGTRKFYSDNNETIFRAMRPLIVNSIDNLVRRGDLADRAILIELPKIGKGERLPETELWRLFNTALPGILGGLFDALGAALANINKVELAELPRMADFTKWIVAAEPALHWEPGTFLAAYARNRAAVVEHSLEGDPVAVAVITLMKNRVIWEGTATELLRILTEIAGDFRGSSWPKEPNILSKRINRAVPFLRVVGIEIEIGKWGKKRGRKTVIRKISVGTVG